MPALLDHQHHRDENSNCQWRLWQPRQSLTHPADLPLDSPQAVRRGHTQYRIAPPHLIYLLFYGMLPFLRHMSGPAVVG